MANSITRALLSWPSRILLLLFSSATDIDLHFPANAGLLFNYKITKGKVYNVIN